MEMIWLKTDWVKYKEYVDKGIDKSDAVIMASTWVKGDDGCKLVTEESYKKKLARYGSSIVALYDLLEMSPDACIDFIGVDEEEIKNYIFEHKDELKKKRDDILYLGLDDEE